MGFDHRHQYHGAGSNLKWLSTTNLLFCRLSLVVVPLPVLLVVMAEAVQAAVPRRVLIKGSAASINDVVQGDVGLCAASVTPHGYKCMEYEVKTDDGYILSMQRITSGKGVTGSDGIDIRSTYNNVTKQPVLIQHGLIVDGASWMLNQPSQNLPFILADKGFDVWIANARGTRYSRKHTTLDPNQPIYWNWSWDEMVQYDLPAMFNLVHDQTGQKLHYVGHSLGTLVVLASLSQGTHVDKLRSAALLSPIAYLSHITSLLVNIAARTYLDEVTRLLIAEFIPNGKEVSRLLQVLCHHPGIDCYDLLTAITGKNCCLNSSTIGMALQDAPQSTATKNLVHLAQTVRHGVLTKFHYVELGGNMRHYGTLFPPIYNLKNIPRDFPLFLSYGGQDALADAQDVQVLLRDLLDSYHDQDKLTVLFIEHFAHLDFNIGVTAKDLVYTPMIDFFNKH